MLDHTSGDPDFLVFSYGLEFSGDLVLGFLSHGTRIEDDDVGVLDLFRIGESAVLEHCSDPRRIGVIHLASEDEDMESHGSVHFPTKWTSE